MIVRMDAVGVLMQLRGSHWSGHSPPGRARGQHLNSGLPHAARPASRADCDNRCATKRAAGRRRDLMGLRRTYGIVARQGTGGATVSGRRLSKQVRQLLRGNPSRGSNAPAPAIDSRNH